MTIQEAIASGKPFRRAVNCVWYKPNCQPTEERSWDWIVVGARVHGGTPDQFCFMNKSQATPNSYPSFNAFDIMQDDWEIMTDANMEKNPAQINGEKGKENGNNSKV